MEYLTTSGAASVGCGGKIILINQYWTLFSKAGLSSINCKSCGKAERESLCCGLPGPSILEGGGEIEVQRGKVTNSMSHPTAIAEPGSNLGTSDRSFWGWGQAVILKNSTNFTDLTRRKEKRGSDREEMKIMILIHLL